jgi:glutamate racemase
MLNQPIAVFDSGVGGLSVLQALLAELPQEHFVFVADEAHLPYGDKPQSFLQARVLTLAGRLHGLPTKALVLACNTATAAAVDAVRMAWPHWPVVGIEPALKPAFAHTRSGVVGVLATAHTIASPRFQNLLS